MSENITEPARVLLAEIIDYAGLFPPSQLPMKKAVENFAAYKNGEFGWMLGRFVVPFARLDEFTETAREFFSSESGIWKLSVLAGEDIYETVQKVLDFNREFSSKAACDTLEIKAANSLQIENAAAHIPEDFAAFFELPLNEDLVEMVATLAIKKQRAKIRTGGVTESAFPETRQIARFMRLSLAANVPFKCTAGLHHALRCIKPLTYEKNAPTGTMNGFLNVFLAAGFLRQGLKSNLIAEILEDDRAENFAFGDEGFSWRREYFLSVVELRHLRARGAISFGSCSFEEPIEDLREIGIL